MHFPWIVLLNHSFSHSNHRKVRMPFHVLTVSSAMKWNIAVSKHKKVVRQRYDIITNCGHPFLFCIELSTVSGCDVAIDINLGVAILILLYSNSL